MSTSTVVVGQSVRRGDALRKVIGSNVYTVDLTVPRMAYGKLLRSPFAHARIRQIRVDGAQALPGVLAVVTGHQFPTALWGTHIVDEPVFPTDRVRFRGEPVAGVVAVSEEVAEEALGRIVVEYEPLPTVFDVLSAVEDGAPLVHPDLDRYERNATVCRPLAQSNVLNRTVIQRGDLEAGFAQAAVVVEATYTTQAQEHVPLEPAAAVAEWQRDGRLVIWTSTQCPFTVREQVARALRLGVGQVRIIVPDVGGGFGAKGNMRLEAYAALLSRAAGRPVKLVHTRFEEFIGSSIGHAARITLRAGALQDGRLVAWHTQAWFDTGAYGESGEMVSWQAALGGVGPYRVPHIRIESHSVYTNKVPAGPFRGMGWPQILWAVESHIDRLAAAVGVDPLEMRQRNIVHEGDLSVTGEVLESVALDQCLAAAAARIAWGTPLPGGEGRGIACVMKSSVQNSTASAVAQLNDDGTLTLVVSAAETGAGAPSAMAQIAAEALGLPYDRVLVTAPDTEYTPFDRGAISDRTTFHLGDAVFQAAREVRRQVLAIAADQLEVDPADLDLRGGDVAVRGVPDRRLPLREVARLSLRQRAGPVVGVGRHLEEGVIPLDPETGQSPKAVSHYKFGAQAVRVRVDEETGKVTVLEVASAHDCGKAVNPTQVEGQIQGAVAQGIGYALMEEMHFEDGQVMNPSLMDYLVPTAPDVPPIHAIIVEKPHPRSPYGVKGVGEPGIIGVAPAIANAIHDACGLFLADLPMTPERVLKALPTLSQSP